jgi:SAM-dependent methyltransferase
MTGLQASADPAYWTLAPPLGGDTATPLNLRKRLDLVEALLPPLAGLRVLDVGCGGGEYVQALLARGADARGLEPEEQKLASAGRLPGEVSRRIVAGDAGRAPFATGSFDALLANEMLEHVPDDAAALGEMWRLLRPGGRLVLLSPNRLHPFETHGVFARGSGRRLSHALPGVPWIPLPLGRRFLRYWARNYWPWELRRRVADAGFRTLRSGYLWQTFENISGRQPGWVGALRPLLRGASAIAERAPVLRVLGASQWLLALKPRADRADQVPSPGARPT